MSFDGERLTFRKVEISVDNFNTIAVPHHLRLLSNHRDQILKFRKAGDSQKEKNEHINATRVITQLQQLLRDMDTLRRRLESRDLNKFDRATEHSIGKTLEAIKEYVEMFHETEKPHRDDSAVASGVRRRLQNEQSQDDAENGECSIETLSDERLQIILDDTQRSEALRNTMEILQRDAEDLRETFTTLDNAIRDQSVPVEVVSENCEVAAANVEQGRRSLFRAERLQKDLYPMVGACAGALLAGPFGLVVGLKLGGLALLSGSALGFTGGRILKKKKELSECPELL